IHHEDLPFDVEPLRYLQNSDLARIKEGEKPKDNPATQGAGLNAMAAERPIVTGAAADEKVDAPSAYVTLKDKSSGQSLGTYLVSVALNPQPVVVNGKTYELALRFKRTYKPYSVHLIEFTHEVYLGTDKPKNFASRVRVVDPTRKEDREVVISM